MNRAVPFLLVPALCVISGCVTTYVNEGPKEVIETKEVMKLLMDPIHEGLKDFIENPPKKHADWRGLYVASFTLAEVNNLLYSRTDHGYMLQQEWRDRVTDARAVTVTLADSVKHQADYETIKANYLAVVQNCNDCHERYDPRGDDAPRVDPPKSWGMQTEATSPGTM